MKCAVFDSFSVCVVSQLFEVARPHKIAREDNMEYAFLYLEREREKDGEGERERGIEREREREKLREREREKEREIDVELVYTDLLKTWKIPSISRA